MIWYHCTDRIADDHSSPSEKNSFGNFLPRISVSFDFPPGISGIFGWMVRFAEILQFPDFLETLPGNFRTIYHRFEIFAIFGWIESARRLWLVFVSLRVLLQTFSCVVVRSIQKDSLVTSRIRWFRFSSGGHSAYRFNFYFLSFPTGELCFCRSGFLHSLQPLSRAALPTYSSPCGAV